jgi:sortase (surface protein transpeptidase)
MVIRRWAGAGGGVLAALAALAACGGSAEVAEPSSEPSRSSVVTTTEPVSTTTEVIPVVTATTDSVTPVPAPTAVIDSAMTLSIPSLAITAPVIESGVTESLVLEVPSDPAVLGRWADGARPGDGTGSIVLAGHVNYRGQLGVLHTLPTLAVGEEALVETPGGMARYVTERVDVYRKQALPYQEIFRFDVPERLVLITCGGRFDRSTGHYDSNVVAYLTRA